MQTPGFWDDIKKAEEVTKESKGLKDKLENFNKLETAIDDVEVLQEMMDEDDVESIEEIISSINYIEEEV